MSGLGFVVAMQAMVGLARYDRPTCSSGSRREWLIVSRWGADGDFLSISRTGVTPQPGAGAPPGLQPVTTYVGVRLSEAKAAGESLFLIARHCPPGETVAGIFAPSDGYAQLLLAGDTLRLIAAGRYAHSRGEYEGRKVLCDVPDPPPRSSLSAAWHIAAERRPWHGEFYPFQ